MTDETPRKTIGIISPLGITGLFGYELETSQKYEIGETISGQYQDGSDVIQFTGTIDGFMRIASGNVFHYHIAVM